MGEHVRHGRAVATSGNSGQSSGPHLHFELRDGDRLAGGPAVDPTSLLERVKSGAPTGGSVGGQMASAAMDPTSDVVDRNASAIIAAGLTDGVPEEAIVSALAVGLVESEMRNLASAAVPESPWYPNDGVDPGDALSVGVLQPVAAGGKLSGIR